MSAFVESAAFLYVLLNPFLLSIYLLDLVHGLRMAAFIRVMGRAAAIATCVFLVFAWTGDHLFRDVLQVRFAAFLIFGGIVFLVVGLRFVFSGPSALAELRGDPAHMEGAVAMPFLIGPGTVSASVLTGLRLDGVPASASIVVAMVAVVVSMVGFKWIYDYLAQRSEAIVQRYVDIIGRLMALVIGTIAVEMILQGVEAWMAGRGQP